MGEFTMAAKASRKSTPFHSYTDVQWTAIEQTLPAQRTLWTRDIRFELEQIGRQFWAMRQQRLRRPSARDRERLYLCLETFAHFESDALKQDLASAYWRLKGWDALLDAYSGVGFQRQRDVHREMLYARVIALWESVLGGRFGVSNSGPLACFLDVVLGPILGPEEMLGFDGIKAMLQREKNRRKYSKRRARELKEKYAPDAADDDWFRIGITALLKR